MQMREGEHLAHFTRTEGQHEGQRRRDHGVDVDDTDGRHLGLLTELLLLHRSDEGGGARTTRLRGKHRKIACVRSAASAKVILAASYSDEAKAKGPTITDDAAVSKLLMRVKL